MYLSIKYLQTLAFIAIAFLILAFLVQLSEILQHECVKVLSSAKWNTATLICKGESMAMFVLVEATSYFHPDNFSKSLKCENIFSSDIESIKIGHQYNFFFILIVLI